ncbi:hypothetical protein LTR53_004769 [Teratosphaeriaceae sp. CCFEE 6253]|nr:hypothetical protein LTR53_004769 [Teratosphaeriaceae sp. CCFEE 6253]
MVHRSARPCSLVGAILPRRRTGTGGENDDSEYERSEARFDSGDQDDYDEDAESADEEEAAELHSRIARHADGNQGNHRAEDDGMENDDNADQVSLELVSANSRGGGWYKYW